MSHRVSFNKTRIAPTPSGFLHLGNMYSFALTAAIAKQSGAKILLRIDDMDHERKEGKYLGDIFDTLHKLNIPWQEGPNNLHEFETGWSQKQRVTIYEKYLQQLCHEGKLYACSCSRSQIVAESPDGVYLGACRHKKIPLDNEHVCWRLNTSDELDLNVRHYNGKNLKTKLPANMHDFIVRRKDGLPAYQLTSLADDVHFDVDLVVRGKDLWPSTLAQLYLAHKLGLSSFLNTTFFHHELLKDETGQKLSKSAGNYARSNLSSNKGEEIFRQMGKQLGLAGTLDRWEDLIIFV